VPLGLHPFERGPGARDVARRQARARLLQSQPGQALRGRDLDRLGVRGRGAGLAGTVEELRAQRKEDRAPLLVRVLEGQLGPLGAVAVGTHAGSPLGRPGEQRDGLPLAAGAEQVVRYRLGRSVVRRKQRGSIGVGAAQDLLRQPSGQLLAYERMPEAVAPAHALEDAGRLGLAERLVDPLGTRECRELRTREAVVDHGERGQQRLAERLEPLEPPRHDLAQPRRHRDLPGRVHRCREFLSEKRIAGGRAFDGG
jgi:hypothetical protein